MNMHIYDLDRQCTIIDQLELATEAATRTRGLIGHAPLEPGQALLIRPCRWIHMFGMSFPIDVLYVNKQARVVAITENLGINRIDRPVLRAQYVIEMRVGDIRRTGVAVGDRLELRP
jgi:uncharacterized membrane protein (UPF0127 family)